MSEFILPIIEIIIGIILLFAGGELFIQGAISLSLILLSKTWLKIVRFEIYESTK